METVLILDSLGLVCRSCLAASGEMKNMLDWGLAEDFFNFTNIRVTKNDDVSDLICVKCEEMLLKFKSFRTQCQQSDDLLKRVKKPRKVTETDYPIANENTTTSNLLDNKLDIIVTAPNMDDKVLLPCPYTCNEKFIKKKDLLNHLIKSHKHNDNFEIDVQYYCTIQNCQYHVDEKVKKFTERKYLNQHYNKVHGNKMYFCKTCAQGFVTNAEYNRHFKDCNVTFPCPICDLTYKNRERLMVHLLRKHPKEHQEYKNKNSKKRKLDTEVKINKTTDFDFICDSPKRSLATQTSDLIRNDVTLPSWNEAKTDEISTQTVFEDLLSLKSQTSEDETIFYPETVLSDIQTQTFPLQFGLYRSNKETITSETQSPDLSMKETQTCFCLYDSTSSPSSVKTSETQTFEVRTSLKSDVLLSFSSAETQTYDDDGL